MEKTMKDILEALSKGVVKFRYMKKDGTVRTATGTTNCEIIDNEYAFKGGRRSETHVPYWDVDRCGWRCFRPDSLVGMD